MVMEDNFFLNGPTPASFLFIFVLSYNEEKNLVVNGIRTRIFGAVGKSADH